jgi:hypothetical protein
MRSRLTWKHIRLDVSRSVSEAFELRYWPEPGKFDTVGHVNKCDGGWYYYARIGDRYINTAPLCESLTDAKHACLAWVKVALRCVR